MENVCVICAVWMGEGKGGGGGGVAVERGIGRRGCRCGVARRIGRREDGG